MKTTGLILEAELRDAVRGYLRARHAGADHVFEEMAVERGSSRIDFATVGRHLEGFELKSDLDNLSRMQGQIHAYNRAFERITMVAGAKNGPACAQLLPAWWGLIQASRDDSGCVDLKEIRPATENPLQENHSVAALLGEDEAFSVLAAESIAARKRASRFELHELIATSVPTARLRALVNSCLFARSPIRSSV